MKKVIITSLIVVMVLSIGAAFANPEGVCPDGKLIGKLNIIGVKKEKNENMEDISAGSVILVGLGSDGEPERCKIFLTEAPEGEGFAVLDKNGTDGDAAFQLPDPDLDPYIVGNVDGNDVTSAYSVFVRPLGKPGGWSTITTCADLADSTFANLLKGSIVNIVNRQEGTAYCSIEQVGSEITLRTNGKDGKSTFSNVTAELLTIVFQVVVDTNPDPLITELDTVCIRVPIFDDILENEYWEYDNHGLKLLQVRFYNCPTNVSLGDGDLPADCQ
jgi:hypothetical protein